MFRFAQRLARFAAFEWAAVVRVVVGVGLCLACTEAVQVGRSVGTGGAEPGLEGGAGAGPAQTAADAGPEAAAPSPPLACQPANCGNAQLACGNCKDDDGDGLIDAADPQCLGPCDDSEEELFTGTAPRVNGSCRTDCFFDRNVGSGDDGCGWSYHCDPLAVEPAYAPTGLERCDYRPGDPVCQFSTAERDACQAGCLPLTPNGCDCFGCCELPAASQHFIWLGSENLDLAHCELETSADPALCRPCTPVPDCKNDCAECELCVGKTRLPPSCRTGDAPALPVCPESRQACDPENGIGCTRLDYCITGCCVPLPT